MYIYIAIENIVLCYMSARRRVQQICIYIYYIVVVVVVVVILVVGLVFYIDNAGFNGGCTLLVEMFLFIFNLFFFFLIFFNC